MDLPRTMTGHLSHMSTSSSAFLLCPLDMFSLSPWMGDVGQMVSGESVPVAALVLGTVGQEVGAVGAAGATSSQATSDCLSTMI